MCSISTSEFSTGNLLMRMKYRAKSFIYIAIFIDLLQKCGRAIPMNTRADLKMEDKPGKDKKPIPPWAKANGLGNYFLFLLNPVRLLLLWYNVQTLPLHQPLDKEHKGLKMQNYGVWSGVHMAPERCNVHKMQIIFRMRFNINFLTLRSEFGCRVLI